MHKSNTLKDLVKFYNKESATLSLLHHSIFLNKVASVAKKHEGDEDDLVMAERVMRRSAAYLFEHSKNLDPHSVAQTLKVLAYDKNEKLDLKFKPTFGQLSQIETKIIKEFPEYLEHDITIPIISMLKLGFYP